MATHPADLAGLPRKGRIAVGQSADLTRFHPEATFTVDPALLARRHPISPYAARALAGVIKQTWLAGAIDPTRPTGGLLSRRPGSTVNDARRR
jgi:allantoinase